MSKIINIITLIVGKSTIGIGNYMAWTHVHDFEEYYNINQDAFLVFLLVFSIVFFTWLFIKLKNLKLK